VAQPDNAEESATPQWREIPFQLTAQGSYLQLKNLVTQLYHLRRLTLTNKIEFRPISSGQAAGGDNLNLELEGKVLYL